MCGHVGVFGKDIRTGDIEVFKELLWLDQLRGRHGTGVAVMDGKYTIHTLKRANDAETFLKDKAFKDLCSKTLNVTARAVMGHNRYATVGNTDDHNNAHPFLHGNVVTAHNGTLDSRTGLEGSSLDFDVDSDQLAYTMANKPLADFIEQVDGAFALVWMDNGSGQNSINFIRNHERPMWFAKVKDKDIWFYASEKWMIEGSCSRKRRVYELEYEELPVGEHRAYTLDAAGTTLEKTEYDLPRFQNTWKGYTYTGGYYGSSTGGQQSSKTKRSFSQYGRFEEAYGITRGKEVELIPEYFSPYGASPISAASYGYLVGYLSPNFSIPLIIGSMKVSDFLEHFTTGKKVADVVGQKTVDAEIFTKLDCKVLHYTTHHRDPQGTLMTWRDDANIEIPQVMVELVEKKGNAGHLQNWLIEPWSPAMDTMDTAQFTDKYNTCDCCGDVWTDKMLATIGWFDADQPVCAQCVEDLDATGIYTAQKESVLVKSI